MLTFRVNPPHTLFGNPDFAGHPTERLWYVCVFDAVICRKIPLNPASRFLVMTSTPQRAGLYTRIGGIGQFILPI